MKIYKFGGASINNIERIQHSAQIISNSASSKLLVVISAMGKTTNALEKVAQEFFIGNGENAMKLFNEIKESHTEIIRALILEKAPLAERQVLDFFTEVEWLLHDRPGREFDYYYDQIVCCGELLSSTIMAHYLEQSGQKIKWLDVRDVIRTDKNFRDASVDWDYTRNQVQHNIIPLFDEYDIVVTQGFIGATYENESTTLGREGSDYSAAIFGNLTHADSVTIWKDVEAVMSADPRSFPDAVAIPHLSFTEVIEMAYYGAQVIHPKTIKPLQNKNIPLFVKSFLNPALPGTAIDGEPDSNLPPLIVIKKDQILIRFSSKDFSFVGDKPMQRLLELCSTIKFKPNLSQNTAISILNSFNNQPDKIRKLTTGASEFFDVKPEKGLELLTIRHYNNETIERLTAGKNIILVQKTEDTIQVLYKSNESGNES